MQTETETITRIQFRPQPKQKQLFRDYENMPATVIGYGGSRGGAKSRGGRDLMLSRRLKYPATNGFVIRKTIDDLRDNHIHPMLRVEHPELMDMYNKQEKMLTLPNDSWLRFISSDNYDDIFKLIGKESADIFVDQAEQFSQEQLEFLITCNRCTSNLDIAPKMLWTFNPGNIGHGYLKRVFIDRDFVENEDPSDFHFIRAFGWDNVMWVKRALIEDKITVAEYYSWSDDRRFQYFVGRSSYGKKLNRLPDSQRQAQLLGSFDVFEGQFLSMWRKDLHEIPPIETVPEGWPVIGVIDYGERTVLEVGTRDFEGRIITFAECYTTAMSPSERFNAMADMLLARKLHKITIYYDTNMDLDLRNYTGYDKTQAQIAREVFEQRMKADAPTMIVVSKATTDKRGYRVSCNEAIKEMLSWQKNDDGTFARRPKLFVTKDCRELIKTAPLLLHDPESPDGLDFIQKGTVDDPYDAWKMLVMALQTPSDKKRQPPPKTYDEYMDREVFAKIKQKITNPKRTAESY